MIYVAVNDYSLNILQIRYLLMFFQIVCKFPKPFLIVFYSFISLFSSLGVKKIVDGTTDT